MGKKISGESKSSKLNPKQASKDDESPLSKQALAAPEKASGKNRHKRSSESGEQETAAVSGSSHRPLNKPFAIVGVGASAGGMEAFRSLLKALAADIGMAFVFVQHTDLAHESPLNRMVENDTAMPILQVKDGMTVKPNHVYIIPPNAEMTITEGKMRLIAPSAGATPHAPIDSFLSALAEDRQNLAIGVILSGIGSDGTKGLQAIKSAGGITFAQDEDSAKFREMPLNAVTEGCVDLVLPPEKIALELGRMNRHPYLKTVNSPKTAEHPPGEDGNLRTILRLMRSASGVDFTCYQHTTLERRISRRMLVRRCETLARYVEFIEKHPDELRVLFQDFLIHVTSFFREPEVYQTLQNEIFPRITSNLAPGESVRIWVPGCSSGEEVYSLAIALHESLEGTAQVGVQIFGTDISDSNIQKARVGIYSDASTEGLSPERLRRYFVRLDGGYQVAKLIRGMCMFGRHDLTKDPPFSHIDLVSCRNVLTYLAPAMQRKVLASFHYALDPTGFLILGKSERIRAAANLFLPEDREANIYSRAKGPAQPLPKFREIPLVILGNDRRIRRFTPAGAQLLNLLPSDRGRPISQVRSNLDIADLDQMAGEVLERKVTVEREVRDRKGHWYSLRMRPYETADNRVECILVVLVDIHDLKQYSTAMVETMRECVLVLDSHFRVLLASPGFHRTFQIKREETEGQILWELGNGDWNIFQVRDLLEKALPEKKEVVDFEVEHVFPTLGRKTMLLNARQLFQAEVESPKILLVIEDITERKAAEGKIHQLLGRLMRAAEDEGKRIAGELHDSFGAALASVNLKVSEAASLLSSQPDLAGKLQDIGREINDVSKAVHDLSRLLHPAILSQLGLQPALEAECAAFSKLHGITVDFSAEKIPKSLPEAAALCLYRVAQECLQNIWRHAHTSKASIALAGRGRTIVMMIRDFGRGFDLHAVRGVEGLGLVNIEERIRLLKGSLAIHSQPGEGTQVEVRIPVEAA